MSQLPPSRDDLPISLRRSPRLSAAEVRRIQEESLSTPEKRRRALLEQEQKRQIISNIKRAKRSFQPSPKKLKQADVQARLRQFDLTVYKGNLDEFKPVSTPIIGETRAEREAALLAQRKLLLRREKAGEIIGESGSAIKQEWIDEVGGLDRILVRADHLREEELPKRISERQLTKDIIRYPLGGAAQSSPSHSPPQLQPIGASSTDAAPAASSTDAAPAASSTDAAPATSQHTRLPAAATVALARKLGVREAQVRALQEFPGALNKFISASRLSPATTAPSTAAAPSIAAAPSTPAARSRDPTWRTSSAAEGQLPYSLSGEDSEDEYQEEEDYRPAAIARPAIYRKPKQASRARRPARRAQPALSIRPHQPTPSTRSTSTAASKKRAATSRRQGAAKKAKAQESSDERQVVDLISDSDSEASPTADSEAGGSGPQGMDVDPPSVKQEAAAQPAPPAAASASPVRPASPLPPTSSPSASGPSRPPASD